MDLVPRSVNFWWENPLFSPIFHVEKSFICCIFTRLGRIKKINSDLNRPFDGECGQLTQPGVWLLYCGLFFYHRSTVDGNGTQMLPKATTRAAARRGAVQQR